MASSLLVNHNGSYEPFQREKLLLSVYDSLRHRKDPVTAATALSTTIVSRLLGSIDNATLTRKQIIQTVSAVLKNFDHAAYVQYTAFHPE